LISQRIGLFHVIVNTANISITIVTRITKEQHDVVSVCRICATV
jgi:hypothetical protein